jgi:acetyltransferase-like isoleucine patch superfamily enzyme
MNLKIIFKKIFPEPMARFLSGLNRSRGRAGLLRRGKNIFTSGTCEFEKIVSAVANVSFHDCQIGRFSYFNGDNAVENCKMGRYCSVSSGVRIGLASHPVEKFVSTHPFFYSPSEGDRFSANSYSDKKYFDGSALTEIGNDVWIGANALIKPGLKIGDGAVIGAGAVVTKDVGPYAIVGGVPAKLIRRRFSEPQIEFLLRFKWWDKSDAWLKENWKDLLDIEKITEKYTL